MSVYREKLDEITQAINSILNQTKKDFQFIIFLDDKENLEAKVLLEEYARKDNRIEFIVNQQNIGSAGCMNLALEYSVGKYIARMDADDISEPTRLEKELHTIEKQQVDIVFSQYDNIDEEGNFLKKSPSIVEDGDKIKKILKYKNIICNSTTMIRKETLVRCGGYSDLRVVEDYELWLRLSLLGCRFYPINETLVKYRIRTQSVTTSNYYLTYCADRYIKRFYRNWNFEQKLLNEEFYSFYKNKETNQKSFNQAAGEYFYIVSRWDEIRKMKYLKLCQLLLIEPRLSIVIWNTLHSNHIRKNYQ